MIDCSTPANFARQDRLAQGIDPNGPIRSSWKIDAKPMAWRTVNRAVRRRRCARPTTWRDDADACFVADDANT